MRSTAAIIVGILLLAELFATKCVAFPGTGTPYIVNSRKIVQTVSPDEALGNYIYTFAIPPTSAGNLLVIPIVYGYNTNSVVSISDNASGGSNSYVTANARASYGGAWAGSTEIWYAKNIKAGATSITVTLNGSASADMWVLEVSGMSTTAPLDSAAVTNDAVLSGNTTAGSSLTVSNPGELVVSVIVLDTSVTGIHSGNGFTALGITNGNNAAYRFSPSAGSYGAVWDTSVSGHYCSSTAAFK
ncbi:MAG: hypothetical protein ACXVCP_10460 [Bdellovibrio sp.]